MNKRNRHCNVFSIISLNFIVAVKNPILIHYCVHSFYFIFFEWNYHGITLSSSFRNMGWSFWFKSTPQEYQLKDNVLEFSLKTFGILRIKSKLYLFAFHLGISAVCKNLHT